MSANTGLAPQYRAQLALAAKVMGLVITSSPGPIPAASAAICSAAVPLLTATQYLAPVMRQSMLSSSRVRGPQVRHSLCRVSVTARISSSSMY